MRLLDGDAFGGLDKAASRHVQSSKALEQKWQRCRAQLLDGIASPVRRADDRQLVLPFQARLVTELEMLVQGGPVVSGELLGHRVPQRYRRTSTSASSMPFVQFARMPCARAVTDWLRSGRSSKPDRSPSVPNSTTSPG